MPLRILSSSPIDTEKKKRKEKKRSDRETEIGETYTTENYRF